MSHACEELAKRLTDYFTVQEIQQVADAYGIAHASMTVNQLIEALEEFGEDGFAEVIAAYSSRVSASAAEAQA